MNLIMGVARRPSAYAETHVFRGAGTWWLAGLVSAVALLAIILAAIDAGPRALLALWPLYWVVFLAWWLMVFPRLKVGEDHLEVRNPIRTTVLPWSALIDVQTRFALTLVTAHRRIQVWAAPAAGARGARSGAGTFIRGGSRRDRVRAEDAEPRVVAHDSPSVKASELITTASGATAYYIRQRWARMVEKGLLEQAQDRNVSGHGVPDAAVRSSFNVLPLGIGAALIVFSVAAISVGGLV